MSEKPTGSGWPEPDAAASPTTPPDPRPQAEPADGVGAPLPPGATGVGSADAPGPELTEAPRRDVQADRRKGRADRRDGDTGGPDVQADRRDGGPDGPGSRVDPQPAPDDDPEQPGEADPEPPPGRGWRRLGSPGLMIGLLLALLGFTLVVQLKTTSTDPTLAATRQEDLVRILSDLEAQEERLREDIADLEDSQRQLSSGAQGREAALEEATRRADQLGILAGTLPARGTGLTVRFSASPQPVRAAALLDAVQELRGAGAEAMQVTGGDGTAVRIVASTYFVDADGGITVDGRRLDGPYTISVIGEPKTMRTALIIPGGVVESVAADGGTVTIEEHDVVDVAAERSPIELRHARPVP